MFFQVRTLELVYKFDLKGHGFRPSVLRPIQSSVVKPIAADLARAGETTALARNLRLETRNCLWLLKYPPTCSFNLHSPLASVTLFMWGDPLLSFAARSLRSACCTWRFCVLPYL
jgi:hypothetical protein